MAFYLTVAALLPGGSEAMFLGSAVLMTIVGLVLLIACSNVANLMLAKAVARQKEIAVRLSMGAGRLRLIRQLLTESTLIALLGGVVGILVAYVGRNFMWSFRPAFVANNLVQPNLDFRVFVFALLISLATGLLFGLVPALQASRFNVVDALKNESRAVGGADGRISLRNGLVVVQVALSIVSLVAAGLFLRGFPPPSVCRGQSRAFSSASALPMPLPLWASRFSCRRSPCSRARSPLCARAAWTLSSL